MKEIAIITVSRALNYGTMLQMYACKLILQNKKAHATFIDYYRKNDFTTQDFKSILYYCRKRLAIDRDKPFFKKILIVFKSCLSYKDNKRFFTICDSFISSHIDLSAPYYSYKALKKANIIADCYCSGSDQIWNSDYNGEVDPAYFLGFIDDKCKKIAFSSSIGKDTLSESEKKEFYSDLKKYYAISVREKIAKKLLSSINLPVTDLIDPTLMVEREEWLKMASKRLVKKPYVLIYKLRGNDVIDKIASSVAGRLGIDIVRITFNKFTKKPKETCVLLPSISDFLSLIINADYIVTNSFHGTCFSINFGKQFTVVPRNQYNSRIENILSLFNLDNRLCTSIESMDKQLTPIDYGAVNSMLSQKRVDSSSWLDDALA